MTLEMAVILISGFIGGFVGAQVGAGAMITLPALLFLGLEPALAIGANILSGWLINVVAVVRFWKSKKIDFKLSIPLSIIALIGAIIGSNLVINIDIEILRRLVAVFFGALIFTLFIKPKGIIQSGAISKYSLIVSYILSFILGIYGGFFSVGVTTFLIFMFVLLLKKDLLEGIANAVFITAVFLFGAVYIFVITDYINYSIAIPLAITSMIGSWVGASVALKFGDKWLKILVALMVVVLIIKLSIDF